MSLALAPWRTMRAVATAHAKSRRAPHVQCFPKISSTLVPPAIPWHTMHGAPYIPASSAGSPSVVLLSKRGMLSHNDAVAAAVVPAEAAYAAWSGCPRVATYHTQGVTGKRARMRSAAAVSNFVTSSSEPRVQGLGPPSTGIPIESTGPSTSRKVPTSPVQSSERVPGFDNAIAMAYF
eukprot:366498-Chlamydomonas_euryale.AAC.8